MLDLTKPVQTRDGRAVRILCSDYKAANGYSIVGAIMKSDGHEIVDIWMPNGNYYHNGNDEYHMDLVNVPQRHKHADVIIAWANGAEIEYRNPKWESWQPVKSEPSVTPNFWPEFEYRVKP